MFENNRYSEVNPSEPDTPWFEYKDNITTIIVEDEIYPTNIDLWFMNLKNCTYVDVSKINTVSVISMARTFENTGSSVTTTYTITGLENWNTSKVVSMNSTFIWMGMSATTYNMP